MNIQYLKYIVEIERCGSISGAAARLYLSQPYLSKILHEVESQYHMTLFSRGKSGITLTDGGRVFLEMCKGLLDNVEQFNKVFQEDYQSSLRLRIATIYSSHVMDAYIRMVKELTDTNLRFYYKEESNFDVINDIYSGAADIGVIIATETNKKMLENLLKLKRITCQKIFDMDIQLVVGENHPLLKKPRPITLDEIYRYNFVMYASKTSVGIHSLENIYDGNAMENLLDWERIKQIIHVYSRASLHNILTQTDFVAIGAKETMEQGMQFHIRSIPFPLPTRKESPDTGSSLCCLYLKDRVPSLLERRFIDSLVKYYG